MAYVYADCVRYMAYLYRLCSITVRIYMYLLRLYSVYMTYVYTVFTRQSVHREMVGNTEGSKKTAIRLYNRLIYHGITYRYLCQSCVLLHAGQYVYLFYLV